MQPLESLDSAADQVLAACGTANRARESQYTALQAQLGIRRLVQRLPVIDSEVGCQAYTCVTLKSRLPHYAACDTPLLTQEPQLCARAGN